MAETKQTNPVLEAAKNLTEGVPPTNVQIEESLDRAKSAIEDQQRGALDAKTDLIAQDVKQVLADTQRLLEEKNRDEKMQRFLLEAKLAADDMARQNFDQGTVKKEVEKAGDSVRPLQEDALEVLQMAKSVIYEIMRSSSFRKSLINAIELFQQVFWDQIQDKAKPLAEGLKSDLERGDGNMNSTKDAAQNVADKSKQQARYGDLGSLEGEAKKQELKRRFNEVLREIGENPEYNQAVSDLFKLTEKMRNRIEKAGKHIKGAAKEVENVHVTRMWEEGQKIIEEFAGHNRIQNIIDALTDLVDFIREDERAQKFFKDLKKYVIEGLEHPEKLQMQTSSNPMRTTTPSPFQASPFQTYPSSITTMPTTTTTTYSSTTTAFPSTMDTMTTGSTQSNLPQDAYDKLYEEGRELFKSEELKKKVNTLISELQDMVRTARRDPAAERLAASARNLMRDLTLDTTTGKPSLWTLRDNIEKSGRSLLLPVLLRELEVVPVKGIRGSTKTYDYAVRNLVFSAYDLLPERARFYMDLDVDIDLSDIKREPWKCAEDDFSRGQGETDVNGEIVLRLDRIKTHVRDVEFHYLRKTFPQMEDWGRLDIDTDNNGVRIEVRWRISSPAGGSAPTVMGYKVNCHIDGLTVTIKKAAQHEILARIASKLFAGTLKERVEREIERSLATFAGKVSLLFNDVFAGRMPNVVPSSLQAALPVLTM